MDSSTQLVEPRAFPADERNEARSFDLIMRLRVDIAAKGGKFFANGMSGLAEFFLEGVDGFAGGVGVLCGCSRSLERGLLRSGIHAGGRVPSRSEKRSNRGHPAGDSVQFLAKYRVGDKLSRDLSKRGKLVFANEWEFLNKFQTLYQVCTRHVAMKPDW